MSELMCHKKCLTAKTLIRTKIKTLILTLIFSGRRTKRINARLRFSLTAEGKVNVEFMITKVSHPCYYDVAT